MRNGLIGLIILLGGCMSVRYSHQQDPGTDFSKISTFYCAEAVEEVISSMPRYDNKANRGLIHETINKELIKKGYVFQEENPDMYIEYIILIEHRIDTVSQRTTNYRYWAGFETDMYNYKKGTIFVNMVDSKKNNLIWQGKADSVLDRDPKYVKKKISKFIEMIFKDFPAKESL